MQPAMKPIILASKSPRRQEICAKAGIPFVTEKASISEPPVNEVSGKTLHERVQILARMKAEDVGKRNPNRIILAADTIVVQHEHVFGKPRDESEAATMLRSLSGTVHDVLTGVWMIIPTTNEPIEQGFTDTTRVWVAPLTDAEIWHYLQTESPLDAAGAYKIQEGFSRHIERIDGTYHNVMGLPIERVYRCIRDYLAM
jgi:septum formation protein